MNNSKLDKIKSQTPISILVHGGNRLGFMLAKTLIEQGCYVIIIDKFNTDTKKYISELKGSGSFDFFEFKGLNSLYKNLKRFDYLFYLLNEGLPKKNFDSKEFLQETGYLETSLKTAKKQNAKVSLISSLALNRELSNRINSEKMTTPSPYSDIELQKYCETLSAEYKDKTNLNVRIVRLGTLLGKGIEHINNEILHSLLEDATQRSQITIRGEGLDVHNVINETDAIYGILKLTFSEKTRGEVITLANRNNYTTLSLAYKLLEIDTEAQNIKFVENNSNQFVIQDIYVPAPHASKYGWSQQLTLEETLIDQIQKYYESSNKTWELKKNPEEKKLKKEATKVSKTTLGKILSKITEPLKKIFRPKKKEDFNPNAFIKGFLIVCATLLFTYFVIYPVIGIGIGLFMIGNTITELKQSILDLNQSNAKTQISNLSSNLERASNSFGNLYWLFKITGQENLYNNTVQLTLGSEYIMQGASELVDAIQPLSSYIKEFEPALNFQTSAPTTTREYRTYLEEIEANSYKVDEASYKISLASEIIDNTNTSVFPSFLQNSIVELKDLTKTLESGTLLYKNISSFIPDLLGVDERKRYLILLQNESEMRSTGGWLTSYGVVGIEGGQVRELFVDDIYNADGTLKIQGKTYSAPQSMKNALEVSEWKPSLVNWYPDLTDTMASVEPFIKDLGKGDDIDGIVTIDISFIQKLLTKWGGIEVPGESELITSDNLYTKIFAMHESFTPGSQQKTTFLADLANAIIQKILSRNIADLIGLSTVFEESLNEKHLQATFKNNDAYEFFSNNGWACSLDSRFNEAPIAIDWNWGGNKANLYLDKNYNLTVDIKDENTIEFTYSIAVENISTKNEYPQGDYVNYQRIYIPPQAEVLSVSGMKDDKYSVYKESGFKVIGGWFNTSVSKIETLEISYRITKETDSINYPIVRDGENLFLDLNLFKQAGESKHAYQLTINYPSTWNLETADGLNGISNQLTSRFELNGDQEYQMSWRVPK